MSFFHKIHDSLIFADKLCCVKRRISDIIMVVATLCNNYETFQRLYSTKNFFSSNFIA